MAQRKIDPTKLKSFGTVVAEEINADPEFRDKWESLALAREVAAEVLRYRRDHGLNQTELGRRLDVKQPQVARLEAAETQPSHETISKVVGLTGAEFAIDYTPAEKTPTLLTKKAWTEAAAHKRGKGTVVVAAKHRRAGTSAS